MTFPDLPPRIPKPDPGYTLIVAGVLFAAAVLLVVMG